MLIRITVAIVGILLAAACYGQNRLIAPGVTRIVNTTGELEVSVAPDGQRVAVAVNGIRHPNTAAGIPPFSSNLVWFSSDGGLTFSSLTPPTALRNNRDPSLAWGGSDTFFFATMGPTTAAVMGRFGGLGSPFVQTASPPAVCSPPAGTSASCRTDQPHIAADRRPHLVGQDEVYVVWREFDTNAAGDITETEMIQCSTDSGDTWSPPVAIGTGHYVRVAVGPDGAVYTVHVTARTNGRILLQRYSSCSDGLTPAFSQPVTVATFTGVSCPVPGLDRCNTGNVLASPMVSPSDLDPNRVFVTFADSIGTNDESIRFATSNDRGSTWSAPLTLNQGTMPARRYLPWSCTTSGELVAAWYDRRSATVQQNDNTEFFVNRLRVTENPSGQLLVARSRDLNLSGQPDQPCAAGWPAFARNIGDSESCSVQPQAAGQCFQAVTPLSPCPCSSNQRCVGGVCAEEVTPVAACDFSSGCADGFCLTGGGTKYGDYNGIACANGSAFVAWVSSVPPVGVTNAPPNLNIYFSRVDSVPESIGAICRTSPGLCRFRAKVLGDRLELKCDRPGCVTVEPVPGLCTRVIECPGCPPNAQCKRTYRIVLEGLGKWSATVTDESGRPLVISTHQLRAGGVLLIVEGDPRRPHFLRFQSLSRSTAQSLVRVTFGGQ